MVEGIILIEGFLIFCVLFIGCFIGFQLGKYKAKKDFQLKLKEAKEE